MDRPRLTLAIETSNPGQTLRHPAEPLPTTNPGESRRASRAGVALGRVAPHGKVELLGTEPLNPAARHDDDLMPAIDRLLRKCHVAPASLERVAVSIGPGGFTGIRIAVVTAMMIAEAQGAHCIAVPTSRVVIRRVSPELRELGPVRVALAWKRDDVWVELYAKGTSKEPIAAGKLMSLKEASALEAAAWIAEEPLIKLLRDHHLFKSGQLVESPDFDPVALLEASADLPPIDAPALAPLYPREPEAVTKWRDLHPPGSS